MTTYSESVKQKATDSLKGIMTYSVYERAASTLANSVLVFSEHIFSDMGKLSVIELKKMRVESGQLTQDAQKEMSLRGDKTRFLQLHRYMFSLSLIDIYTMFSGMRRFVFESDDGKYTYSDQTILKDLIDFHVCFRDDKFYDAAVLSEIASSFYRNISIYEKLKEHVIDSNHMIKLATSLLKSAKNHPVECSIDGLSREKTIFVKNIQGHFNTQAIDAMPRVRDAIDNAEDFEANQMRCSAIDQICNFSAIYGKCLGDMDESEANEASDDMLAGFAHNEWIAA